MCAGRGPTTRRCPLLMALAMGLSGGAVVSHAAAAGPKPAVSEPLANKASDDSRGTEMRESIPSAVNRGSVTEAPSVTPQWKAVLGGLVLLGLGYGGALAAGASVSFDRDAKWLAAPVVGPWIALGKDTELNGWVLAGDGVVQLLGALIAVGGFVYPERVMGPSSAAQPLDVAKGCRGSSVTVMPIAQITPRGHLSLGVGAFF